MTVATEISPIKILLVDDHQMMIDGLKALLLHENNIIIAGEANNGKEALNLLQTTSIDVIITDINMPKFSGIELTVEVKEKHPETKVLALSMHQDSDYISEVLEAGASGYILKNTGKKELLEAINRIANNFTYLSPEVEETILQQAFKQQKAQDQKIVVLTNREQEILKLIAEEFSNQQIAEKLFISERTVETHRKNIFRKTKTKSIVGLIQYSIKNKWI